MATKAQTSWQAEQEQQRIDALARESAPKIEEEIDAIPDDDNLEGFLNELGDEGGGTLSVYRSGHRIGRNFGKAYCFSGQVSDYDLPSLLDKLRDEYNGGEFRIQIRVNGRIVKNKVIEVEPPQNNRSKAEPEKQQQQQPDIASLLMTFQQSMAEQTRAQQDQMRDLMLSQAQQTQTVLLEIIKAGNGGGNNAPPPMSVADVIALAKSMAPKEDNFELFLRGLEMGKDMGGKGDGDESLLQSVINTVGGPLVDMAKAAAVAQASAGQQSQSYQVAGNGVQYAERPELPASIAAGASNADAVSQGQKSSEDNQVKTGDAMNFQQLQQLQPYIQILANAAALDADVETYANLIIDQVPWETIEFALGSDENYEKLFEAAPALKNWRQWFDDLREVVLLLLQQEKEQTKNTGEDDVNGIHGESGSAHVSGESIPGGETLSN